MLLDVFTDFACPWSAIGVRRLARVLDGVPPASRPTVSYRALLRGEAGDAAKGADADILAVLGADVGLRFHPGRPMLRSTLAAHAAVAAARPRRRQAAVVDALVVAWAEQARDLGDVTVVADVLAEVLGVTAVAARQLLDARTSEGQVAHEQITEDLAIGRHLGLGGVPHLIVDGRRRLAGLHDEAHIAAFLDDARRHSARAS